MLSLDQTKQNKTYIISSIEAGSRVLNRLGELSIYEGAQIHVLRSDFGPIVLKVLDSKIAIGRGQAKKIFVKEC